jgi:hypothetical protein
VHTASDDVFDYALGVHLGVAVTPFGLSGGTTRCPPCMGCVVRRQQKEPSMPGTELENSSGQAADAGTGVLVVCEGCRRVGSPR